MWPFYLRVDESTRLTTGSTRLTMGSTRMSQVLNELGQKSTRIEICKKNSTQPDQNPWWAGLTHGFQPILTALLKKGLNIFWSLNFQWILAVVHFETLDQFSHSSFEIRGCSPFSQIYFVKFIWYFVRISELYWSCLYYLTYFCFNIKLNTIIKRA